MCVSAPLCGGGGGGGGGGQQFVTLHRNVTFGQNVIEEMSDLGTDFETTLIQIRHSTDCIVPCPQLRYENVFNMQKPSIFYFMNLEVFLYAF